MTARHDDGDLRLTLKNNGSAEVRLTLTSAYAGRPRTFTVRAGRTITHTVDLERSDRWYDLTVTSNRDSTFLRRFAGHVETGRPGLSDPGIVTG